MEYGLAITKIPKNQLIHLQQTQQQALRRMFGGHNTSEVAVIQHLSALPTMYSRSTILQAKYINRANYLPPDALLSLLLPRLNSPRTPWTALKQSNKLWSQFTNSNNSNIKIIRTFLHQIMRQALTPTRNTVTLLSVCTPSIKINPLLLLPMETKTRSMLIRWRRGWIPGQPSPCACLSAHLTKNHTLLCPLISSLTLPIDLYNNNMHPADILLNMLPPSNLQPSKRILLYSFWQIQWPALLKFIGTVDAFSHQQMNSTNNIQDNRFLLWLNPTGIPHT